MKGEEDKIFDDFLRNTVGDYKVKPSPAIWKNILHKIPGKKFGPFPFGGGNTGIIGLVAGGAVVTTVMLYQWNTRDEKAVRPLDKNVIAETKTITPSAQTTPDNKTFTYPAPGPSNEKNQAVYSGNGNQNRKEAFPLKQASSGQQHHQKQLTRDVKPGIDDKQQKKVSELTEAAGSGLQFTPPSALLINTSKLSSELTTPVILAGKNETLPLDLWRMKARKNYYINQNQSITQPELPSLPGEKPATLKIHRSQGSYFSTGLEWSLKAYYYPEWLNNPGEYQYGKFRQSGGLSVVWKKQAFSLETGLGIMKETGLQQFDLTFNQILGTYYDLQYIQFDTSSGNVVPIYYYDVDTVFDDQVQSLNQVRQASYSYLQLPFIIGIEKSMGRHDLSLKTGPVFSMLLGKKNDNYIMAADKRILTIEGDHPNRLTTSWQWYLGLGYSYNLTDRVSFFLEPAVRGYLNTPYETRRRQKDNPIYMGIRSGIIFQFNNQGIK